MERNPVYVIDTILPLLEQKKYATLRDILTTMQPIDIANLFNEIEDEKLPILFRILPKEIAAETFVEMDEKTQEILIHIFSDKELKAVVDELYVDDVVDIIEEMPANVVKRILRQADPDTRKLINEILNYPDDSAGSIMTTEYVSLRPQSTITQAIANIRATGIDKETIYTCYVTNVNRELLGYVSIKDIILADVNNTIESIMNKNVISVHTLDDQEAVANLFKKYDFVAMPVVDKENRLVGIVTVDDAIDVMHEEMTEDIEKMAAISPTDKPYTKTGVFETWRKRIVWLLVLMISASFTSMIITSFESALAAQVVLTAFIPMLMNTGGSSGSQSSVSIIRALSTNDLDYKDVFKVVWKEFRVAILCGITLSAANFLKLLFIDRVDMNIAFVVCITLVIVVVIAKVVGSILPIGAKKLGFDPTVMASPLITTVVDAVSLIIYFYIAHLLLGV